CLVIPFFCTLRRSPRCTLVPYTTLFRSCKWYFQIWFLRHGMIRKTVNPSISMGAETSSLFSPILLCVWISGPFPSMQEWLNWIPGQNPFVHRYHPWRSPLRGIVLPDFFHSGRPICSVLQIPAL